VQGAASHERWGEAAWRTHLMDALAAERSSLVSYRVVDRGGAVMHLECPLRLKLGEEALPLPATAWLPFAMRTGLMPEVDLRAAQLVVQAIRNDGQQRGVNIAPASLKDSRFLPRLRRLLEAEPEAARLLWLEVAEGVAVHQFESLQALSAQLHELGVRVGLEHAGARLAAVENLPALGLHYVKLEPALGDGLHTDGARQAYVAGLVRMLRGVGALVIAEGVARQEDADALWAAGVDGITGPWVG
jgi:EAL domain-containing protein (putative c-di-GMP-specific phosphodiesterase class I)